VYAGSWISIGLRNTMEVHAQALFSLPFLSPSPQVIQADQMIASMYTESRLALGVSQGPVTKDT
jgi:hypothetical protein